MHWLILRGHVKRIIVTGVPEAFFALLKVDLVMALVVTSPLILYHAASFVMPGLTPRERKVVGVILAPGLVLFIAGMAGGFFIFVPIVLHVMKLFVSGGIQEYWSIGNYLSFIINLTIPFGFVAELPLVAGVLANQGMLTPQFFRRYRRHAVLVAFLISGILAPPDATSMIVMAIPIYLVFEVSGLVARVFYRQPTDGEAAYHSETVGADSNPQPETEKPSTDDETLPILMEDGPWEEPPQ